MTALNDGDDADWYRCHGVRFAIGHLLQFQFQFQFQFLISCDLVQHLHKFTHVWSQYQSNWQNVSLSIIQFVNQSLVFAKPKIKTKLRSENGIKMFKTIILLHHCSFTYIQIRWTNISKSNMKYGFLQYFVGLYLHKHMSTHINRLMRYSCRQQLSG